MLTLTGFAVGWVLYGALTLAKVVPRYRELYGDKAYAPKAYQDEVGDRVHTLARQFGIGPTTPGVPAGAGVPAPGAGVAGIAGKAFVAS